MRKQGESYRFVDDRHGVLETPPHEPILYDSDKPDERLIDELILATKSDNRRMRLACIEELGWFPADRSIVRLKKIAEDADLAVQGAAYAALIALDTPPAAENLSLYFAGQDDPGCMQAFEKHGTCKYRNSYLKRHILHAMELRFTNIEQDHWLGDSNAECVARKKAARTAAAKWKDFDLIGFLESAPWLYRDPGNVQDHAVIAEIIGAQVDERGQPAASKKTKPYRKGSRTIVLNLLNSAHDRTRFEAVRAIDRMIAEPHNFPHPREYQNAGQLDAYVKACRLWLAAHPDWETENN